MARVEPALPVCRPRVALLRDMRRTRKSALKCVGAAPSLHLCTHLRRIAGLLVRVLLELDRLSGLVGEGLDEAGVSHDKRQKISHQQRTPTVQPATRG